MSPRDPREFHPGFERNVPGVPGMPLPPPRVPQELSPPAHARPATQRPAWFVHWSPGSIAAGIVAVIVALGGATGLRELLGSAEATRDAIAASEQRIIARLEEQRIADQHARDALSRALTVERERTELISSLSCVMNEGPPHETWPCDLRLVPPPAGNLAPRWTTARRWPVD